MADDTLIPAELSVKIPEPLIPLVSNYWHDWLTSCDVKQLDPSNGLSLAELGYVWACSDFVARNCIRYPEIILALSAEGFEQVRQIGDYRNLIQQVVEQVDDEDSLMSALRLLRQQEMIRIAWRDLNALADIEVILQELTDLAEAMVSVTLRYLEQAQAQIYGMPLDVNGDEQFLLTAAMGKMGGGELNFSSDIDLIFSYAEDGETSGRRHTSHYEFYLAVIRKLVKVLDEVTADGFVYRVDTRLRPFGNSGPMAMSFSGMEQYYQLQGRDWERYAMIKAKIITGREQHRQELIAMLTPFVFRRYLDFTMLDSIREMKAMISAQMKRKQMRNNIKLGRGGIREIEFIGQTLQLIRAGREPELRERSIIKVLKLLAEKDYLEEKDVARLISAYWFLRKLENRLQMQRDMQTHTLPDDDVLRQRLCLAMGFVNWERLLVELALHQDAVDHVFQNIVAPLDEDREIADSVFFLFWKSADTDEVNTEDFQHYLHDIGYTDVDAVIELLVDLHSHSQIKVVVGDTGRKLIQLVSSLVEKIADYPQQVELLDRVCRIIKALAGRKVYISLLNEYAAVQLQMLTLCAASEWFAKRLTLHPILLDSLLSTAETFRRHYDYKKLLALELGRIERPDGSADEDLEQQMDRMRQFKRQMVFTVAMLDVFYEEPVERVSDRLTDLANTLLEEILALSWQAMVKKHGQPGCIVEGVTRVPQMSIIAYGKLGGNELGYGSDLDIIFLHDSHGEKQLTDGERSIDNQHFFARVAQRVIHFLNTRTYSGVLYEADTRLRPDGHSGLMVSSVAAFDVYQHEKAWVWEHQALIRARFITGNARLEQEFDRIRSSVLRQVREPDALLLEVVAMRDKMRDHLANKSSAAEVVFDIKQDAGGLVDIEFMTQAGALIHAERHAGCIAHTATLELISELKTVGWFSDEDANQLSQAYRVFRKVKNWQNLQCDTESVVAQDKIEDLRRKVEAIWITLMPASKRG